MRTEYRCAISAGCGVLLLVLAVLPETVWGSLPTVCLFRNVFAFECPGCGMTRSLALAVHGDPGSAFEMNRGVVLAAPALLAGLLQGIRFRQ